MKPCPECQSENVFKYKEHIVSSGGEGPILLPSLASSWFSVAKFLPVVCADCGLVRFYASKEARVNLQKSEHWMPA